LVNVILFGAMLSLVKVFNGNFLGASRMVYAMGNRRLIWPGFGRVHGDFGTPGPAILFVGAVTVVCVFFGKSALVPISDVGSLCYVVGWSAACVAYVHGTSGQPLTGRKLVGIVGALVSFALMAMMVIPFIPGSLGVVEWSCLAGWTVLGFASWLWRGEKHGTTKGRENVLEPVPNKLS
jgi:APA family basic amino acid/polyamine antiporter